MNKIAKLRNIGKLKDLQNYYRVNKDGMTTAEISAIYSRAITLDSQNRTGASDQGIQKYQRFIQDLVRQITESIDKLPVSHLKYLVLSVSKLGMESWVQGTDEMVLKLLEMVLSV